MIKIKNKTSKIIVGIFSIMLFMSCENILQLEPQSRQAIFWQDNNEAELGILSIYDAMQKNYRKNHFYWGEFRGDNYEVTDKPQIVMSSLINSELSSDFAEYTRWNNLYLMISRANLAIEKIPQIDSYDPDLLGEAHILRAYAYFDAYRLWGDVPLHTLALTEFNDDAKKPRSPKEAVLELILSDLAQAETDITTEKRDYRFSRASLFAFKAKIFMFITEEQFNNWNDNQEIPVSKTKYKIADEALQSLEDLAFYTLTKDQESWRNLFLNDSEKFPGIGQTGPELILSLKYTLSTDGFSASGVHALFTNGNPPQKISYSILKKWSDVFGDSTSEKYTIQNPTTGNDEKLRIPHDYRFKETVDINTSNSKIRKVFKYAKTTQNSRNDDTNIILFRYADMLLLWAEAKNKVAQDLAIIDFNAFDLVDRVRLARNLAVVNRSGYSSNEAIENLILNERQFELLGEGARWWDLVRTGKASSELGIDETKIQWPIYRDHLIVNEKLTQNDGY